MTITRRTVVVASVAVGLALGSAAGAQEAASGDAPAPTTSCLSRVPAPDSVNTVVHLSLALWRPVWERAGSPEPSAAERDALTLVLQQMRATLTVPREISIGLSDSTLFMSDDGPARDPEMVYPALRAGIVLTLHADGRVSNLGFEDRSNAEALDAALVTMLKGVSPMGELWNLIGPLGRDSVRLLLATTHHPRRHQVSTPLMRVRLPIFPGTPIVPLEGPSPRYPAAALQAGVGDTVHMWFVVDTAGRVDLTTARVMGANYADFIREVRRALPKFRFTPMRVAGCPVRQLAQQSFIFSLSVR